jgi:hypothetical protein
MVEKTLIKPKTFLHKMAFENLGLIPSLENIQEEKAQFPCQILITFRYRNWKKEFQGFFNLSLLETLNIPESTRTRYYTSTMYNVVFVFKIFQFSSHSRCHVSYFQ